MNSVMAVTLFGFHKTPLERTEAWPGADPLCTTAKIDGGPSAPSREP